MWLIQKSNSKASSRKQIAIKEVRDGILVLPHNQYRTVIETSSINFELKSEAEQDVLIDNFQNFLNALPSPIQVLIRVREVDIDQYVDRIQMLKQKETHKIYRQQINHYCDFIQDIVSGNKILSRHFYLVIPYQTNGKKHDFELAKEQLQLNRDLIAKGLQKIGMKAKSLDSLEVLELFYNFYNPNQVKTQQLKDQTVRMLMKGIHA